MPALLIHDGYTLDGTIKARGPWPALKFRYRPALPEDACEYLHQTRNLAGKAQIKPICDLLGAHLVSWDVADLKGEVQPIKPELLRRLPHPYLTALVDHVLGYGEAEQEGDVKN